MVIDLKKEVKYLKGVGPARAKNLEQLSIVTVKDLLTHIPSRYEDRRRVKEIAMLESGETALVKVKVLASEFIRLRGNRSLLKVKVEDKTGRVILLFFNQPYMKDTLKFSDTLFVHGKFERTYGGLQSSSFTFEKIKREGESKVHVNRIVPIYALTSGISQKWLRRLIYDTLSLFSGGFFEFLPSEIRVSENLYTLNDAVRKVHFPLELKEAQRALKTLVMGEFLLYQTALSLKKLNEKSNRKNHKYEVKRNFLKPFREKLLFEFTSDQKKAINEIFKDMCSPWPMRRLLQGEVGSGKTVVALSALLLAAENSYQGAVVAPTEILAEQHYLTFKSYGEDLGVRFSLLTGSTSGKTRDSVLVDIKKGDTDIIIGTHALFEDDVDLSSVKLLVVDEQHRFGVKQKARVLKKNIFMDSLSMSATPIPRTMAMCTYGDLDISTIKKLPSDRKKPVTKHVAPQRAYSFALEEIRNGNRAYIVHPVIEESEKTDFKSAKERYLQLQKKEFKNVPCGLLHGKMKSSEKEKIMRSFAEGKYMVLFTTTVVEVGINVPEATVMIIENFERYGLSTLHQLRGRIARSHRQPYCFLTGKAKTETAARRLEIMLRSSDGFEIAEEDLKLRGSGELFGTRQHGEAEFKYGDPVNNIRELKKARKYAFEITARDNNLEMKEYEGLKKALKSRYARRFHLADVS